MLSQLAPYNHRYSLSFILAIFLSSNQTELTPDRPHTPKVAALAMRAPPTHPHITNAFWYAIGEAAQRRLQLTVT